MRVYVVEVFSRADGAWSAVNPLGEYGGRLNVFRLRYMADRAYRVLRLNGYRARVSVGSLAVESMKGGRA